MRFAPPPIRRVAKDQAPPLSFAQERLWFLEQLEPGSSVYNICRAARLTGPLKTDALERSLNEVILRHEVLRARFAVVDGRPEQVTATAQRLMVPLIELHRLSYAERETETARLIAEEARRPFDLSLGPLLRPALLCLGHDDHILILTTHHIVSDAWSMGILTREIWTLYEAYANGNPSPLQDLPIQYADYAVWQREWLRAEVLESQVSYWKKQLDGISMLNLPTDGFRPKQQSFSGARQAICLSESLTAAVNELSKREGVTPFMTLLAALQTLLYRYSGQEDVVVGSPITNRNRTEVEGLIGFFVNTLVLRTDLSGNPTFKELLLRVRAVCLGAYAHQDLPFEKLVQELQPDRDLSRHALFQVMFVLQNTPRHISALPGLSIERIDVDAGASKFDLTLGLAERDQKLNGFIEYSTDLFDGPTIERMAGHFQVLLEGIVAHPDRPISTLPLLTEAERHQLLIEWNNTELDFPRDACIHELFEAQVERTPEAVALEFEGKQLTYRELNTQANELAHYLRSLGVGPEKLVGICIERSLQMVIGLLGILKAGGAYVPLDPADPKERVAFMLEDTQASVLLTQRSLMKSLPNHCAKIVCMDADWEVIDHESESCPPLEITAENLAYVIYTSGSTGRPKGVPISHRALCNHIAWTQRAIPLTPTDNVMQKTPLGFDASVWELFAPLLSGARLVVARPGGHQDSRYLIQLIAEKKITTLKLVPSLLRILLAEKEFSDCRSLKRVFCGGDILAVELQQQFYGRLDAELYNLYGPTEACIDATYWPCRSKPGQTSVPIGRPIANTQVYILDRRLNPVPIGIPGELCIGGSGLARGYLNRPDLTAETFVPHPFISVPHAKLYRTGDVARYLPDGNIDFLGRADHQVKIRGFRIELDGIEVTLNQHPGVRESVVVARDDVRGEHCDSRNLISDRRLVAYVVPTLEAPPVTDLRNFLKEKLPDYMLPSSFVMLQTLPLTTNGKIDRNALPALDGSRPQLTRTFVEPRTETEELVTRAWSEVLKLEKIGAHDNFFELGGHSLLAIQVVSRVRDIFHRKVALRVLFEAPTIAGMATKIERTIRSGRGQDLPPIVPAPRDGVLPLSMNQEQLWSLDQMVPRTHFFNMPYVYRLSGNLNVEALEMTLKEIFRRHEALRTVFTELNGRPVQVIKEGTDFQLPVIDLRSQARSDVEAAGLIVEERQRPFDLSAGPLLRTTLLRLTDTDSLLLITMHHMIGDHWSTQLFRRELAELYGVFAERRPSPLPDSPIQFPDYVCWEKYLLDNGLLNAQLAYWKKQLAGPVPKLEFKKNGGRRKKLSFRTTHQRIEVDESLFAGINALARKEKCTPFMVLVAALNILLHLRTGQRDIWIGTLVANRAHKEVEGAIGHFLNTVILRTRISAKMTVRQLLRRVRHVTLAAHAHQELPFEYLARVLEEERNVDRCSLFQVLFNYQSYSNEPRKIPGLTLAPLDIRQLGDGSDVKLTAFDLIFNMQDTSTKFTGSVNYKEDCFERGGVASMVEKLYEILKDITLHPYCQISRIRPHASV